MRCFARVVGTSPVIDLVGPRLNRRPASRQCIVRCYTSVSAFVVDLTLFFSARLAAVEYRLLPHHPLPAALQDAAAAYLALLRRGIPGCRIVLIGDSSGGHLALALTRWIRDMLDGGADDDQNPFRLHLRKPAGLVLLSVRLTLNCRALLFLLFLKHSVLTRFSFSPGRTPVR